MNPAHLTSSELETFARFLAEKHMKESGTVPPTVLLNTGTGLQEFRSQSLTDVTAKDKMVQTTRLLAIANQATAVTIILECWARLASKPGGSLGERQECVIIVTETQGEPLAALLQVERNTKGRFVKFTRMDLPALTGIAGRFAGLLPRKKPTPAEQHQAKVLLGMFGIQTDGTPLQPHLN